MSDRQGSDELAPLRRCIVSAIPESVVTWNGDRFYGAIDDYDREHIVDAIMAGLRFGTICTACGTSDYTAEDHADRIRFDHTYLPAFVVRGVKPAPQTASRPVEDDR